LKPGRFARFWGGNHAHAAENTPVARLAVPTPGSGGLLPMGHVWAAVGVHPPGLGAGVAGLSRVALCHPFNWIA